MYKINDKIEDFRAMAYQDDDFKEIKFSDYDGKWRIIVFYPADFTFVCPTELGEMADNYETFKKEGAELFSVSCDTEFTHMAWHDASDTIKKIKFPMLADPTGKLAKAFGVYMEDAGLALRGSFVIDPEGVLKTIEIHEPSVGRSCKELLRKLRAAKFAAEHGQVCPASWEPGDEALTPGKELVGKI
ncbi:MULTISPECIES: peroxiredoxin [Jonquetella]|uniref:Peroxiredoxin n=1 Tax=Jonquetella anthropi DSM 22815 TaxID=885272 RepID=H0UIY9_9BACT|nr:MULTISPECIES: redoxin domain-containing protein [Jonquetella]EEX49369.1 putative peroxiredoxin [Jonquetella anthropi E3_33 E1]EHM13816.1 peroxiredoxin [Jonquetella anthropi DSM 22815]ERL24286.1 putative peroxiredoxin [Jonquetella sp. BV3C21]